MPMTPDQPLRGLLAAADALERSVKDLTEKVEVNDSEIKANKRRTNWLVISVIADIVLSIIISIFGGQVLHNQDALADQQRAITTLQTTQQAQTSSNKNAQCALMELFLSLEQGATTTPTQPPPVLEERKRNYATLHEIYDDLACVPN